MPADEKDSAATNRLLDLLRSQQTGKSTTEGNASGTIDNSAPREEPKVFEEDLELPEPTPSVVSSSIVPDVFVEEEATKEKTSKPISSDEIRAKLGSLGIKKPAEEQTSTPAPSDEEKAPKGTAAALMDMTPGPDTTAALRPAADPKEITPPAETDKTAEEGLIGNIDPSYFQVHQEVAAPNKFIDLLYEFRNWAFGVQRKITVQCTADSVRIMKMKSIGDRNFVESMDEYRLPYEVGDQKITHRDDLLAHILDTFDPKLWKKDTMFRMYSSQIETITKVFKAPPVKGKEIDDLITWTAKKNLPFSSENINIDHKILDSEKGELKRTIIIGVGNNETISHILELFKKRKFDLQNVTTIPFLDWQSFQHCYPDRQRGCVAIVHVNRNETTITMVKSGRLEFNREMAVGVKDYHKALVQRVMVGNDAVNITETMATSYLMEYGIPLDTDKDIPDTGISLYKISIFLRPVIERMTSEINRSLDYFKKQVADVECQEIYFTGLGAAIPNLIEVFQTQLGRPTEHLNLLRQGDFEFPEDTPVDHQLIPIFTTNFSLAFKTSDGINLLPPARKQHFQYRIFNKLVLFLAAILLPLYLLLGYFRYLEEGYMEESVVNMRKQWEKLSEQSQEYFVMLDDLEFLGNYWGYLSNDRINSENQIKLLKLISSEIPDNIKITSLIFKPASSQDDRQVIKQDSHVDGIIMSGLVNARAGIADIQLTNFRMRLESLNLFTNIKSEAKGNPPDDDRHLLFTLQLEVAVR
ncbi:MAG: pilus assembly protein PilM [Candidatus Marinimicrobia bacterium]|nr:pilus assembly protein PilM [Candidatus Neomarinimicrobiota bacterium]